MRAVWAERLPGEESAPQQRIIHVRGVQLDAPTALRRLGLRVGRGYFKCGSRTESDWVSDVRVLAAEGTTWQVIAERRDVPRPLDGQLEWLDLDGAEAAAVRIELRRCGVDDWWPSWNLATSGLVLLADVPSSEDAPPAPATPLPLTATVAGLADSPAGVSVTHTGTEVRFRSRFLDVGFSLERAQFTHLGLDEEGAGRTQDDLLKHASSEDLQADPHLLPYSEQGLRLHAVHPEGRPNDDHVVTGTVSASGGGVTYELEQPAAGQRWSLRWTVTEDALALAVEREGAHDVRAWSSSAWQLVLAGTTTPTTALGRITRQGETGLLSLPTLFHAPRYGSVEVTGSGSCRSDAVVVPLLSSVLELKATDIAEPEGDYLLPAGRHRGELRLSVRQRVLVEVPEAPGPVQEMLRRCSVTAVPYRADTATFSNSGNSIHAPACLNVWGDIAAALPAEIVPGLRALDLQRDSLERWLDDAPAYASGRTSTGSHLLEDEYLLTGCAALDGLATFLDAAQDSAWLAGRAPTIRRKLDELRTRDLDGDGLVESEHRRGISGEGQWSTTWFDGTSMGGKDALTNAVLYPTLRRLAAVLPRLGQAWLAEGLGAWADRLHGSYVPTFLNAETGWIAGWRSTDGVLHDYAYPVVNGLAVTGGLLEPALARDVMQRLWDEMARVGFSDFRLGVPVCLWPIPDHDLPVQMHRMEFGYYMNGGATHSLARHFVEGLHAVGMTEQADRVLLGLAESLADGTAYGPRGSGVDWRYWDGRPCGYEGQLSDQFGVLVAAVLRYAAPTPSVTGASFG